MIQGNELRIGNWVFHNGKPLKITNVLNWCVNMEFGEASGDRNDEINIDEISPFPVTKEVLVQCGFEISPWGYVRKSLNDFGVILNLRTFSYEVSGNNSVKIQYLHQLQNLYFALTGEELIK